MSAYVSVWGLGSWHVNVSKEPEKGRRGWVTAVTAIIYRCYRVHHLTQVLRTDVRSPGRTVHVLSHWTTSPASNYWCFYFMMAQN